MNCGYDRRSEPLGRARLERMVIMLNVHNDYTANDSAIWMTDQLSELMGVSPKQARKLHITAEELLAPEGVQYLKEALLMVIKNLGVNPIIKAHLVQNLNDMKTDSYSDTFYYWELIVAILGHIRYERLLK